MLDNSAFHSLTSARPAKIERFTIELSSACNLRCLYCHQSIEGFTPLAPMTPAMFDDLVAYCRDHGIKRVDLTGGGEATFAPNWQEKCQRLVDIGVELSVTTNMARLLKYEEMATLSRFAEITLSLDSVDRDILRKVRKSEDVRTLVYNFAMMRAAAIREGRKPPHTVLCMVLCAEVVDLIDWLGALAISLGFDVFRIQDVIEYRDIRERVTPLWKLEGDAAGRAAAAIRRLIGILDAAKMPLGVPEHLRAQLDNFCATALDDQAPSLAPDVLANDGGSIGHTKQVGAGETRDCLDPWTFVQVLSDGSVRPCCASSFNLGTLGPGVSMEDILDGAEAKALRHELLTGNLRKDCASCPIKSPVSLQQHRQRFDREVLGLRPVTVIAAEEKPATSSKILDKALAMIGLAQ